VARFVSELHDPQAEPDAAVTAKARELTANSRNSNVFARSEATFSTSNTSQSSGGPWWWYSSARRSGLWPRPTATADKANLMRAMLSRWHYRLPDRIYSGDRNYVREEWAPGQFNHCIIAIRVSDETQPHDLLIELGRLLISMRPTKILCG
jgi:hypothetical protein